MGQKPLKKGISEDSMPSLEFQQDIPTVTSLLQRKKLQRAAGPAAAPKTPAQDNASQQPLRETTRSLSIPIASLEPGDSKLLISVSPLEQATGHAPEPDRAAAAPRNSPPTPAKPSSAARTSSQDTHPEIRTDASVEPTRTQTLPSRRREREKTGVLAAATLTRIDPLALAAGPPGWESTWGKLAQGLNLLARKGRPFATVSFLAQNGFLATQFMGDASREAFFRGLRIDLQNSHLRPLVTHFQDERIWEEKASGGEKAFLRLLLGAQPSETVIIAHLDARTLVAFLIDQGLHSGFLGELKAALGRLP